MNIFILLGLYPYLSASSVEESLSVSSFSACATIPEGLYTIRFSVNSDGRARLLEGNQCFVAVEELSFPKHPHTQSFFVWEVIHQGGVLFPQTLRQEKKDVLFPGILAEDKERLLPREESMHE